jgi:hypothetical protein
MLYAPIITWSTAAASEHARPSARSQALAWLAAQLRWEKTLAALRREERDHRDERRAA